MTAIIHFGEMLVVSIFATVLLVISPLGIGSSAAVFVSGVVSWTLAEYAVGRRPIDRSAVGRRMRLGAAIRRVAGGCRRRQMDESGGPRPRCFGLRKAASVGTGRTPVPDRGLLLRTPIQLRRTLNVLGGCARSGLRRYFLSVRKPVYRRQPISPPRRIGARDMGERSPCAQSPADAIKPPPMTRGGEADGPQ